MKTVLDLTILTVICLMLVFIWFHKGLLFAGGEEGIPFYDLDKTLEFISFSWQDVSAGFPIQLNLNRIPYFTFLNYLFNLGINGYLVQAIHFFIILSFGTISLYFLLRETLNELKNRNPLILMHAPLIGAVFYLLNPFSMTQIWGRGLYLQFFPFALFPFFLLMFILGLKHKNLIFGILGLIISVFFAGAYGNPSYIISQWLIICVYLFYHILRYKKKKKISFSIFYFVINLVGWLIVHLWWIYPFLKTGSNQLILALNNWEQHIGTLRGVSPDYQLAYILRLVHRGYVIRDQQYGQIYLSTLFFFISWVTPLVALASYKIFKKLKIFSFYIILFLVSIFICTGSNLPTGWLFEIIFKNFPPFQSFRNPFEKFGLILTIAYSPFFAIGSIVVSNWLNKKYRTIHYLLFLASIVILTSGIFLWPIWTGHFAGGFKISPWVKVPEYYKQTNDWLNKQKDDGRIIHFPINPGDGIRYSGWDHPYQGREPGEYIFSRPSIGKNGQELKYFYLLLLQRFNNFQAGAYGPDPDISNSEFKDNSLYEELAKLNVRYIIFHRDLDPNIGNIGQFEPVVKILEKEKNVNKINSFGKLDIYKVEIPENIHLIYSPNAELTYQKINPTLFKTSVIAKEPFSIYFLENFDPNWEAYIDNQKIENHSRVFSYANKWDINRIGSFDVILKYQPQDFVDNGMKITKVSILFLIITCLSYFSWKLYKKNER